MKNINLLIIASSDMDGTEDDHNLPSNVIDIEFPCSKYNGKHMKEKEMASNESPRCKKCNYTEVEHKYGYPIYPLNPAKLIVGKNSKTGKPVYSYSIYSDFWRNKTLIFERIKILFGDNININYNTITPNYKNNLSYLSTIDKINNIVSKNLKLKGKINYKKPYHYSCMLNEIYTQSEYDGTKYDCIFVVSGGLGWLYTPENFKIMSELLSKKSKLSTIGNLWYKPILEYPEYKGQFKFMNPINSCLNDDSITRYDKKDVDECVENYAKILLDNKFKEAYEMLFKQK